MVLKDVTAALIVIRTKTKHLQVSGERKRNVLNRQPKQQQQQQQKRFKFIIIMLIDVNFYLECHDYHNTILHFYSLLQFGMQIYQL